MTNGRDPRGNVTTNQLLGIFAMLERFITLLYVPIIGWMLLTVLENKESLTTINASRYTQQDGYEFALEMNRAMETLRQSVSLLQQQQLQFARELAELKNRS